MGDEPATLHSLLAKLYEDTGDSVNAEKHWCQSCELAPAARECLVRGLLQAEQLVQSGDVAAASKRTDALKRLMGNPPESQAADLLLVFARILMRIPGQEGEAERYYDRVLQLEPANATAHWFKGLMVATRLQDLPAAEVDRGRQLNEQARGHFLEAMRLGDERAAIPALLASLYEMAGDPPKAEKYRRRHCELEPAADACITRALRQAQQWVQSGDFSAAQEAFARAHQAKPEGVDLWLEEGIVWQKAGRHTEAERAYREALRLDSDSHVGHDNLAFVLFDLGRVAEAKAHFERALELDPGSADALAGKAITLEALGDHLAALRAYKGVVAQDGSFLDCDVMEQKFLWSEAACQAAQPLIEAVSRERPRRTVE